MKMMRNRIINKNSTEDKSDIFESSGDLLLDCLVYLCRHFGKPKSSERIKAGLAYDKAGMDPTLFCEAASRLDFRAEIIKKTDITRIAKPILPCVLFLSGDHPCVLLSISVAEDCAKIFLPETGAVRALTICELMNDYTGYAIFIHPHTTFDMPDTPRVETGDKHWFWGLVRQNRSTYAMVILASLFINLFALVSPLFIMNVYDRVIPNNAIETGWALGIGALVAFVFDFIFRTVRGYMIDFAGRRTDVLASRRIYDHVLDMKLADRPSSSGGFANMLRDFDSVREFFTSATITALVDLPFSLLFLFFVFQLGGGIAFILVGLIFLAALVGFFIQLSLKHLICKSIQATQTRHGLLVETIHGLETIKANHADGRFRARYGEYIGEDALYAQKSRFLSALGVNIATFLQQIASVIIILNGMYLVQDGDMSVGGLIACVILGGRAIAPIGQIANLIAKYHYAGGALKTLNRIMSSEVERPAGREFLHRPDLSGHISFENVSFSYPQSSVPVLTDVSFTIQQGERVGIIGRVGSGKSTVARLMLKLYDPDSGAILADNTDYRQIDPADLRKNIAYLSQDVVLFQGSVRDNIIASASHASEAEILACAKAAGVDDFVSRHPMGYDMPVGEQGNALSGGQRQAIALARAMITKPNILICDEPTSAMDVQAENNFCKYVREQTKGKTFILVTHKHSMLTMVDRLILIHEGKVIMDGRRADVIDALNSGSIKVGEVQGL